MVNKKFKGSKKNKIVRPPPDIRLPIRKGSNKKRSHQNQRRAEQNHAKKFYMSSAMSTWAQHFAEASTWQLKHQLAFWKARAMSLQYENTMLHEVIRNNHLAVPTTSEVNREAESDSQGSDSESEEHEHETERNNIDYTENDSDNVEDENNEFEVSEEFIQFLTANAKYKEDARRERERLKAKSEAESKPVPKKQESVEDKISRSKELYGDKYKRIMALEMYLMSNFQNEADRNKATYWPNIPFNFNVS